MSMQKDYQQRFPLLEKIAEELESILDDLFSDFPRIDRISTRAKSVIRFTEKANRTDPNTGERKYNYPLEEIQDQIGARIVVFFKSDVEPVAEKILAEIREIEDRTVEQPDPESFSYEARHFVCLLPQDIVAKCNPPIDFFELQVSTLFQHAWAEANHDLGYKSKEELCFDDKRRIAWAAAQAWGADMIFYELWNKYREET